MSQDMIVIREHLANHGETGTSDLMEVMQRARAMDRQHKCKHSLGKVDFYTGSEMLGRMEDFGIVFRVKSRPSTWVLREKKPIGNAK